MQAKELRKKFTSYFSEKGHSKIPSSSLVPLNDPTLLFNNAGMNQFKDYFTGKAKAQNPRATSIQKCVRAGGKHNDLENVGFTARHHTFFEMLGNFSFGDYFKKEAISFAWEFLTKELKIDKDKLYVTVHHTDQEAADIWHEQEGVPRDRIFFRGDKDNFWEMGDLGPCGPSSEIFYDHGQEHSDGSDTSECILDDESRYVEIWNLVFMQYEKYREDGEIKKRNLPRPSVDTGAGLERLSAVINGVYWNYDTDLFMPLIDELEKISGKKYAEFSSSMRVIADHVKSATMLLTDGVIPSNDGRGYVLRRIIRRGVRHLDVLGIKETTLPKLIPIVFNILGEEYPQNAANQALAENYLKLEEENFRQTLSTGLDLLNKQMKKLKEQKETILDGKTAFKFYDTYGFPVDLTQTILEENNLEVDEEGFKKAMEEQKSRSKQASQFQAGEDNLKTFYSIKESSGPTKFLGYDQIDSVAKLVAKENINGVDFLIFDQTPFYGESGGQAGDKGEIFKNGKLVAKVLDTQIPVEGLIAHVCEIVDENEINHGEFELKIDFENRQLTMRNHSATHLLQASLISVLGDHIKQAGSMVSKDRLRFDFTHPKAMTKEEIKEVEKLVNLQIQKSLPVEAQYMSMKEAQEKGAMALFGEKYGSEVRVLTMGEFSMELCGGTHVSNTSDIGLFVITNETSLSSGVRRMEAMTSTGALDYLTNRSEVLEQVERKLACKTSAVLEKVEGLQKEVKTKSKEIKSMQDKLQAQKSKDLFSDVKDIGKEYGLVVADLGNESPKSFRNLSDKFVDQNKKDVLLLVSEQDGKSNYLCRTHKANAVVDCSSALKAAQSEFNGRGGGRKDMAQGSGDIAKDAFIQIFEKTLRQL
ncbi:MAG: alanine--tRNA ligase [Halobacteriovoraceae bacterium]|nr:alanine--tRNA ligase [Halobacteriovoraceae bacterium]|tara:strand:- start:143894 stop:146503 length:2610 start_codon:yes stop_codon:yes gene_type:complete